MLMNIQGKYSLKAARAAAASLSNLHEETHMIIPVIMSTSYKGRTSYKYDVISFTTWLSECREWGSPLGYKEIVRF